MHFIKTILFSLCFVLKVGAQGFDCSSLLEKKYSQADLQYILTLAPNGKKLMQKLQLGPQTELRIFSELESNEKSRIEPLFNPLKITPLSSYIPLENETAVIVLNERIPEVFAVYAYAHELQHHLDFTDETKWVDALYSEIDRINEIVSQAKEHPTPENISDIDKSEIAFGLKPLIRYLLEYRAFRSAHFVKIYFHQLCKGFSTKWEEFKKEKGVELDFFPDEVTGNDLYALKMAYVWGGNGRRLKNAAIYVLKNRELLKVLENAGTSKHLLERIRDLPEN